LNIKRQARSALTSPITDFRGHGRKAKLLDRLTQNPPKVNALLMEGTLVGERSNELTITGQELENKFLRVIKETKRKGIWATARQALTPLHALLIFFG